MKIIITHLNADFDALASLVAASKLFPDAKVVLPASMDSNVECFLNVCGNSLMMPILETPDPQKITEVIIVDAAPGSRIGKPFEWIQEYNLPVRVYDHHKPKDMPLDVRYNYLPVGSTTTILVKKLMREKVKIKPV
ncbi:MAG: DHH family phosphoesterase, partial [Candidatus Aureabacteria bacterium]|nr:DHH family phosphoesterase [Candidatus Auribacterota bacterium]